MKRKKIKIKKKGRKTFKEKKKRQSSQREKGENHIFKKIPNDCKIIGPDGSDSVPLFILIYFWLFAPIQNV